LIVAEPSTEPIVPVSSVPTTNQPPSPGAPPSGSVADVTTMLEGETWLEMVNEGLDRDSAPCCATCSVVVGELVVPVPHAATVSATAARLAMVTDRTTRDDRNRLCLIPMLHSITPVPNVKPECTRERGSRVGINDRKRPDAAADDAEHRRSQM